MSINSSDLSKQVISALSLRQEQRAGDDFRALRQANEKTVQTSAGANRTDANGQNAQSYNNSAKVEPRDVEEMNSKMSQLNVHLTFEMTEDRNQNIVKVLDQATGDVVRQIPTEEFLKMSERIDAIMSQLTDIKGTLVNSKV